MRPACQLLDVAENVITMDAYATSTIRGLVWITKAGVLQRRHIEPGNFGDIKELAREQQDGAALHARSSNGHVSLWWGINAPQGKLRSADFEEFSELPRPVATVATGSAVSTVAERYFGNSTGIWHAAGGAPVKQIVVDARPRFLDASNSEVGDGQGGTTRYGHVVWVDNDRTNLMVKDEGSATPRSVLRSTKISSVSRETEACFPIGTRARGVMYIVATAEGIQAVCVYAHEAAERGRFRETDVVSLTGHKGEEIWSTAAGHILREGMRLAGVQDDGANHLVRLGTGVYWINRAGQLRGVTNAATCAVE